MFSALPVEILACVLASTSGLMRKAMRAVRPRPAATSLRASSSGSDSTLKPRMPSRQRVGHLLAGLADAGKDDAVGRHAGGPRAAQLAFRHHVHAGAEARQRGDHRLVGVGLDGVADQRVEPGEGLLQHAVVPLQRGGAVAVEGRADRARRCARGSRPPRGGPRRGSRNGAWQARQRINGSRMEGLWGTGSAGRARRGIAGLVLGPRRCLERAAHAAARHAEHPSHGQRNRNAKRQTAVHVHLVNLVHSPQHQHTSENSSFSRSTAASSSPFPAAFPTALSRPSPFCPRSVARFPHSSGGS